MAPLLFGLGLGLLLGSADAGAQTRTQTYQPGEGSTGRPGGAPGRGGEGPPSNVYCQDWPGRPARGPYPGTGPQTPCGLRAPGPPQPPPARNAECPAVVGSAGGAGETRPSDFVVAISLAAADAPPGALLAQASPSGADPGLYIGGRQVLSAGDAGIQPVIEATPARREIFKAMSCSKRRRFAFRTSQDLQSNILIRESVIGIMDQINSGRVNLGFVARGFMLPEGAWERSFDNPNGSVTLDGRHLTWQSADRTAASAAIQSLLDPAHRSSAECLTGLELAVLAGVETALGAGEFDALHPVGGTRRALHGVGVPVVRPTGTSVDQHLVAVRSLTYTQPSSLITQADMVPGDYAYMSSLPDYERWHPGGGWNGENAIYMRSATFYGLGLGHGAQGYQTEAQLQQNMAAAYNDGYTPFVIDRTQAFPFQMRWTLLASPVKNGSLQEAGPFVR